MHYNWDSTPFAIVRRREIASYCLQFAASLIEKYLAKLIDPGTDLRETLLRRRESQSRWAAHLLPLPLQGLPARSASGGTATHDEFAFDLASAQIVLLRTGSGADGPITRPPELQDLARLYQLYLQDSGRFDLTAELSRPAPNSGAKPDPVTA